jgi:hypothetical protein
VVVYISRGKYRRTCSQMTVGFRDIWLNDDRAPSRAGGTFILRVVEAAESESYWRHPCPALHASSAIPEYWPWSPLCDFTSAYSLPRRYEGASTHQRAITSVPLMSGGQARFLRRGGLAREALTLPCKELDTRQIYAILYQGSSYCSVAPDRSIPEAFL